MGSSGERGVSRMGWRCDHAASRTDADRTSGPLVRLFGARVLFVADHRLRFIRLRRTPLHPWLQPLAPSGPLERSSQGRLPCLGARCASSSVDIERTRALPACRASLLGRHHPRREFVDALARAQGRLTNARHTVPHQPQRTPAHSEGPDGANGCSHGWSEAAGRAEPVESEIGTQSPEGAFEAHNNTPGNTQSAARPARATQRSPYRSNAHSPRGAAP
jgi:hypothetical protein